MIAYRISTLSMLNRADTRNVCGSLVRRGHRTPLYSHVRICSFPSMLINGLTAGFAGTGPVGGVWRTQGWWERQRAARIGDVARIRRERDRPVLLDVPPARRSRPAR